MNDTLLKDKYRIVREIARSNDIVYEAMDVKLQRRLAIKELNIASGMTGQARRERIDRFDREARAAGKLSHTNIVHVYEHWEENGRYFIAMEFLEGQSLGNMLKVRGALAIDEAVGIACQTLDALTHAHQHKVIHRDIKPDNIHILPGGTVKLTDFGIARLSEEPALTSVGQIFGTPSYMSPEQIEGKFIDHRSDIFSLGVLLYEMLAGRKPFLGDSVISITYAIMNAEPAPLMGVPAALEQVVRRALAKRPEQRYATAEQMRQDLRAAERAPSPYISAQHISAQHIYPQQSGAHMRPTGMGTPPMPYGGMNAALPYNGANAALPYGGANASLPYNNTAPAMQNPAYGQNTMYGMPPVSPSAPVTQPHAPQGPYTQFPQNPTFPQNGVPAYAPQRAQMSSGTRSLLMALCAAVIIGLVAAFGIIGVNKAFQGHEADVRTANVHALMNQANASYGNQDYASAAKLFEKALAARPGDMDSANIHANLAYTYTQLGRAAKLRGDVPSAVAAYEKALEHQPDYKVANQELAEIKESQHDTSAGLNRMAAENSTLGNEPPATLAAHSAAISDRSASPDSLNRPASNADDLLNSKRQEARNAIAAGDAAFKNNNTNEARKQYRAAQDAAGGTDEYDLATARLKALEGAGGQ